MKVILYMAITANGMIAESDDSSAWISQEESNSYCTKINLAKALVVGHRTYDILTKQPEYKKFQDVKMVVIATKPVDLVDPSHKAAKNPQEALEIFKDQKEVIVAGGGILNAAFLKENLVDEIFLDIEPALVGQGIPLFKGNDFTISLELVDTKKLSKNEVQLHYKVIK
jgi:dihydrofolate reductase